MRYVVTGGAGFIGSNTVDELVKRGHSVVVLDDLSAGKEENLAEIRNKITFIKGSITDIETVRKAMHEAEYVLHLAARTSVPRSVKDPIESNRINIDGTLNVLVAARDAKVKRVVFAASSSAYGETPTLPKVETMRPMPISPYGITKYVGELYLQVFGRCYGLENVALRYFNVFGPRQDPEGAYAAVIPQWVSSLIRNRPLMINGDGETSRDFCFIDNVVQANLLAATVEAPEAVNQVYNVALNERTSLNQLYLMMRDLLQARFPHLSEHRPHYQGFRAGDVRHSQADIGKARELLGFHPSHRIGEGLQEAMDWYVRNLAGQE